MLWFIESPSVLPSPPTSCGVESDGERQEDEEEVKDNPPGYDDREPLQETGPFDDSNASHDAPSWVGSHVEDGVVSAHKDGTQSETASGVPVNTPDGDPRIL